MANRWHRTDGAYGHRQQPTGPGRRWVATAAAIALVSLGATALSVAAIARGVEVASTPIPDYTARPIPTPTPTPILPLAVFIGDSFVGGSEMGGNGQQNWTAVASKKLGWYGCPFGIGGSGWTRGINEWTFGARVDWALSLNPSVIVFANGINDLTTNPELIVDEAAAALSSLRAQNPEIPVIVVGQIRVRDEQSPFIERKNAELAEIAHEFDATFIDPTASGWFDEDARSWLGEDKFHPTDQGSIYLADQFAQAIESAPISTRQRTSDEAVWCSLPDWRTQLPDGSVAPPTPAPTS